MAYFSRVYDLHSPRTIFLLFLHHVSNPPRFTLLSSSASLSNLINTLYVSPSISLRKMLNMIGFTSLSFQRAITSALFPLYVASQLSATSISQLQDHLGALMDYLLWSAESNALIESRLGTFTELYLSSHLLIKPNNEAETFLARCLNY